MSNGPFKNVTRERIIGLIICLIVMLIITWLIVPRGGPVPDISPANVTEFPRASASVPIEPASSEEAEAQGIRHDLGLNAIEKARELAGPAFGGGWLDEREEPHEVVTTDEAKKAIENAITNVPF